MFIQIYFERLLFDICSTCTYAAALLISVNTFTTITIPKFFFHKLFISYRHANNTCVYRALLYAYNCVKRIYTPRICSYSNNNYILFIINVISRWLMTPFFVSLYVDFVFKFYSNNNMYCVKCNDWFVGLTASIFGFKRMKFSMMLSRSRRFYEHCVEWTPNVFHQTTTNLTNKLFYCDWVYFYRF